MRVHLTPRAVPALIIVALWLAGAHAADRSPAAMAGAASDFLQALTLEQRQRASLPMEATERTAWHFLPTEMFARHGITLGEMTAQQRTLANALIESALSERGFLTARAIMDLESVLRALEPGGRFARDPERYFFSVFGTPGPKGAWGWRVEGHHLSLNFTIVNGAMVTSTPMFVGSNPAEIREGPQSGLRVLARQEDLARALVMALDEKQRAQAVISPDAPDDIQTMNRLDIEPLSPAGIAAIGMTNEQQVMLLQLIDAYISVMASDIAADRAAEIKRAGIEKISFAWAGSTERGTRHYYRVQGPSFLIEFDNTQNDANHVHAVWRDFNGDFGRDLLREHLSAAHQQ
jgi:hypothetical protein